MSHPEISWTWSRYPTLALDDLYDALALRCRVFILEQGPYLDPDGLDRHAWHLLGRDAQGELLACARIVDPGWKYEEPSLGRVVVAASMRGSGLGAELVAQALARCDEVWPGWANRISAQAHLQRFYAVHGYTGVGEVYLEDEIAHRQMLRPGRAIG